MAIFGASKTRVKTKFAPTNYGQIIMMPTRPMAWSMETSDDEKVAQALIDGTLQDVYSAIGSTTRTVTFETQVLDWWDFGFYCLDELPQTSNNIPWPAHVQATVTKSGTDPDFVYEVSDTGIVSTNLTSVLVWQTSDSSGNPVNKPLKKGTSTPAAGEFIAAAGKISFHSSLEGCGVTYEYAKTYTSGETYGRNITYDKWGTIEAAGVIHMGGPTDVGILFKSLQRTSRASIEINDGVPTLSTTFKALVPSGQRSPIELYNLDSLVA